jgi:hypothetical protein
MGKSKCKKLTANSEGYHAIKEKVLQCWNKYGDDIEQWPIAAKIFPDLEHILAPYGENREQRLNKMRFLYNKLTKLTFLENGKLNY